MPWVRFESREMVRIALAAGAIPAAVAAGAVELRCDGDAVILPAEGLVQREAIRRLGGRFLYVIADGWPIVAMPNWFAIVPCVPAEGEPADGPWLIAGPARELTDWWPKRSGVRRATMVGDRVIVECDRRPGRSRDDYHRIARGNWVRAGWQHRLAAILPPRPDDDLLFDPSGVIVADDWHDTTAIRELDLPATTFDVLAGIVIPITLQLAPGASGPLHRIEDESAFGAWLAPLGPSLRERIRVARLTHNGESMLVAGGTDRPIPGGVPLGDPAGLSPRLREDVRQRVLAEAPDRATWIEGSALHQAPRDAFRSTTVAFAVRPAEMLTAVAPTPFAFDSFATVRNVVEPELKADRPMPETPRERTAGGGWLDRVFAAWRPKTKAVNESDDAIVEPALREIHNRSPLELERSLTDDYVSLSAKQRCRAWAELAEVYTRRREFAEASLAWLNAVWEHPSPPAGWLSAWAGVERDPVRQAAIRTIAGDAPVIDEVEDWPVRLVWLTAMARRDPLHRERTADRLAGAMAEGLHLDRDAPAFLRRTGGSEADAVRDWVRRNRENAGRWIGRILAGEGRLQRVGLDADPRTTIALGDAIIAAAADRCGEGVRARAWRAEAEATLAREPAEHRPVYAALFRRVTSGRYAEPERSWPALAAYAVRQFEQIFGEVDPRWRFLGQPPGTSSSLTMATIALMQDEGRGDEIEHWARSQSATGVDARLTLEAAAWLAAGRTDRGMTRLDACREQLFAAERLSPFDQSALAIGTARALAFAPPRIARGRLEELFHRLKGIDTTGSTNRYYPRQPLALVAAAFGSAVPRRADENATAVARWLAEDERIVRTRIAADRRFESIRG